jgi:hypothetical protein
MPQVCLVSELGTFDYWTVHADADLPLQEYLSDWIADHPKGWSGIINVETIGGRIIECHLRMTSQWPDLNGAGWLDRRGGYPVCQRCVEF